MRDPLGLSPNTARELNVRAWRLHASPDTRAKRQQCADAAAWFKSGLLFLMRPTFGADLYSVIAMLAASRACAEMAIEKGTMAEERAAMELKIVGKTKSVGDDTSITVGAPLTLVTTTTGTTSVTRGTGEIDKITAMSTAVLAVSEAAVDPSATPPVLAEIIGKPAIDMRSINIGLRLDSADDSARVSLVTHYIGTGTVGAYFEAPGATPVPILQTDHNAYDYPNRATDNPTVRIRMAQGVFFKADTQLVVRHRGYDSLG